MEFSLQQVPDGAQDIILSAERNASPDHATLITFSGDLGAGKTTMIQEVARLLGVREDLQSPTFVIYKIYEIPKAGPVSAFSFKKFVHGDMYRLESADEIVKLGWGDLLKDPKNLICLEWPEKVAEVVPAWAIHVVLGHTERGTRMLDIDK